MTGSMLRIIIVIFQLGCLLAPMACGYAGETTFRGRIVDFDTKKPIVGAVVVAVWYEARATIAGESTRLKDVRESLTDTNGNWAIKGPKGRMNDPIPGGSFITGIYYTREPEFIVFKPGYCSWPNGFTIEACRNKMIPHERAGLFIGKDTELPKLQTNEERLINIPGGPIDVNANKLPQFFTQINEERISLGLRDKIGR